MYQLLATYHPSSPPPPQVVNFTRVTLVFLRNLVTGIEDGLTTPA